MSLVDEEAQERGWHKGDVDYSRERLNVVDVAVPVLSPNLTKPLRRGNRRVPNVPPGPDSAHHRSRPDYHPPPHSTVLYSLLIGSIAATFVFFHLSHRTAIPLCFRTSTLR